MGWDGIEWYGMVKKSIKKLNAPENKLRLQEWHNATNLKHVYLFCPKKCTKRYVISKSSFLENRDHESKLCYCRYLRRVYRRYLKADFRRFTLLEP